jgi:steroid Delta-isomerase
MTATPEAIIATLDAYTAAYRNGDKDALLALYVEDCEWTDPVGTPTHYGRAGVAQFWDDARAMADAIVIVKKDAHICGNEVAMPLEIHATIGGSTLIMDGVDIFTFDDDARIVTGKAYWDMSKARPA